MFYSIWISEVILRQIEIFLSHTRLQDRVLPILDMLARCRPNLSKNSHYICEIIRIYHEYEGGIVKSVPRITEINRIHHWCSVPTRGSTVTVGNEACRVSHWTVDTRVWIFLELLNTNDRFFFSHANSKFSDRMVQYTVISCLFVVWSKLLPRGAVDDLMHYYTRPKAECNSASVRPPYRGEIVWLYYNQA